MTIPTAPNQGDKVICWYIGFTLQTFVSQYRRVDRPWPGVKGAGSGGRGGGNDINYLVKIITENKVFHFLRNWKFLSASDVCQIPFSTFISWFGNFFSLSLSLPLSVK